MGRQRLVRTGMWIGLLMLGAGMIGCSSTDYHSPEQAAAGGRGGDDALPAVVSAGNNCTDAYAGDPPSLKPAQATTPEVPPAVTAGQ